MRKVEEPTVYKIRDEIISQKKAIEEEEKKIEEELYKTQLLKKKSAKKSNNDANPDPNLTLQDKTEFENEEKSCENFEPEEKFGFKTWATITKKFFDKEKAIVVFNLRDVFNLHYQSHSRIKKSGKSNSDDEEYYIYADYLPPEKHEL